MDIWKQKSAYWQEIPISRSMKNLKLKLWRQKGMNKVLAKLKEPVTVFLDGHFLGGDSAFGDEDINPDGFDGLIKQVERTSGAIVDGQGRPYKSNSYDLEGKAPTILLLQEILGAVYSAPNYGEPDVIYVTPNVYAEIQKQIGRAHV